MKNRLTAALAIVLIVLTVFSGCVFTFKLIPTPSNSPSAEPTEEPSTESEPSQTEDVIFTEPTAALVSESEASFSEPYSSLPSSEPASSEPAFSEPASSEPASSESEVTLGEGLSEEATTAAQTAEFTSRGYVIVRENGLTYIDGVLVVNKTYSLPESYNPGTLLYECSTAFALMQKDAKAQGISLYNSSGFRSYSTQAGLYSRYCSRDGVAAADRYSARPGYSEHQTGLAIDLNTIAYSFADTKEGKWVEENCWKYGFILRYPEGKEEQTGYRYEPWHIRYVGNSAAERIYKSGLCLEEFFGITSQYA